MFIKFTVQDFNLSWSPIFNTPDLTFHAWFQRITFKVAVLFLSLALVEFLEQNTCFKLKMGSDVHESFTGPN